MLFTVLLSSCKASAPLSPFQPKLIDSQNLTCSHGKTSCPPPWLVRLNVEVEVATSEPLPAFVYRLKGASPKPEEFFKGIMPCGGAYIKKGVLITAAHCVYKKEHYPHAKVNTTQVKVSFYLGGKTYVVPISRDEIFFLDPYVDAAILTFNPDLLTQKLPPHTETPTPVPIATKLHQTLPVQVYGGGTVIFSKNTDSYSRTKTMDRITVPPQNIKTYPPKPPKSFVFYDKEDIFQSKFFLGLSHEEKKKLFILLGVRRTATSPHQGSCPGDSGSPMTQIIDHQEQLVGVMSRAWSQKKQEFARKFGTQNSEKCGEVMVSPRIPLYHERLLEIMANF